jgi:hypothetical protein
MFLGQNVKIEENPTALIEAGFEVSKVLVQHGIDISAPAFTIRWGQIASVVGEVFSNEGLPIDRVDPQVIIDLVGEIQNLFLSQDVLCWDKRIKDYVRESPAFLDLVGQDMFNLNREGVNAGPVDFDKDDPMDGDEQSALASAGMGTDEDYGAFDPDPLDE